MSHRTPTGQPAAAAVTLYLELQELEGNVEALRRVSQDQLDNLATAVGLAQRLRDLLKDLESIDVYISSTSAEAADRSYGTKA